MKELLIALFFALVLAITIQTGLTGENEQLVSIQIYFNSDFLNIYSVL